MQCRQCRGDRLRGGWCSVRNVDVRRCVWRALQKGHTASHCGPRYFSNDPPPTPVVRLPRPRKGGDQPLGVPAALLHAGPLNQGVCVCMCARVCVRVCVCGGGGGGGGAAPARTCADMYSGMLLLHAGMGRADMRHATRRHTLYRMQVAAQHNTSELFHPALIHTHSHTHMIHDPCTCRTHGP